MQPISREVVEQAILGNQNATEMIIVGIQRRIYNLAVRFLWEPLDAEDATQEILIRVVHNLASFRGDSAFETWVHRIAVNHLLKLKARHIEQLTFDEGAEHLQRASEQPDYDAPDKALLAEEVKISCTTSMLICLSRPLRIAYILGEILEFDGNEASYVLDISPATFRKRLSLARHQLRTFMQAHCGIFNPDNPCRCTKKIRYDIAIGRMEPQQLRFADKGGHREPTQIIEAIEMVGNEIAILRSHPDYQTPERLLPALKQLIDRQDGRLP